MSGRVLLLLLGATAGVALGAALERARRGDPARNGGRERTERLRREIEEARERLRDDLARARGQQE